MTEAVSPASRAPGVPLRAAEFLRQVRVELVKVAWPGRAEVIKYTTVVLCTVVLLTAVVFGLDASFAKAVLVLFGK
ncbi:MAG: preprotein translocase subunit SecE [Acidimicrobiales bacterium]